MKHLQSNYSINAYGLTEHQFSSVVSLQVLIGGYSATADEFDIAYLKYTEALPLGSTDKSEGQVARSYSSVRTEPCQRNNEYKSYRHCLNAKDYEYAASI